MRRLLLLAALVGMLLTSPGCLINQYCCDPNERMEQLLFQSEDLRQICKEWRRFWLNDQPQHMTYERVHGGIGP